MPQEHDLRIGEVIDIHAKVAQQSRGQLAIVLLHLRD